MKSIPIVFLLLLTYTVRLDGQDLREIEGKILDIETREPVPYANIYNKTLQKGTISNADGYFRVSIPESTDSLLVIFIGYQTQLVMIKPDQNFYTIYLRESSQLLKEIVVTPKDNTYLLDLLMRCKKQPSTFKSKSKGYFELKTFGDNQQMELLEGYFNIGIAGYDITNLTLKAGRLALHPFEDWFFVSLESSKAVTRIKTWAINPSFPYCPLSLPKDVTRKYYDLSLDKKYLDDVSDSIYVINYDPVDTSGRFFYGQIWVNKTNRTIIKISLNCPHARVHPFLPLFDSDSILNVNLMITRTFTPQKDQIAFNHIDFIYKVDYKSRVGDDTEKSYSIKTEAILYAYDYGHPFFLPLSNLTDSTYSDYRKINATPYNDFFWRYNDEYSLHQDNNENELFYNAPNSITNQSLFKENHGMRKGLFEQPFVLWSEDRVFFRDLAPDTIVDPEEAGVNADNYNLEVKYFVDINTYGDSTNIFTGILFDTYESYYHLPMDNKTHCFINIFFDLCEIERRKLDAELITMPHDENGYKEAYQAFVNRTDRLRFQYLKTVDRGLNQVEMVKWNDIVFRELGINNIAIFKPYDP